MALWQWSKTSTANATADPTINWSEGMPPSAVNDSARAMMARLAEFRDDISCSLTTGGTASAYTLTTNEGLATPTPTTGQQIGFVVNATNNPGATLAADGGSAYPIQSQSGQAVGGGVLVSGSPYTAVFSGSAWILRNFYSSAFVVPIGGIIAYTGASAPNSSFVFPSGQAISRTTYATYFAQVGTTFGPGDGSTTFNVPDLRNRTIFMQDNNIPGSFAGRISVAGGNFDGTVLGGTGGSQNHLLTGLEIPPHSHPNTLTDPEHSHSGVVGSAAVGNVPAGGTTVVPSGNLGIGSSATGITINNANAGGGLAHTILSPAMTLPFILRVI